MINSSLNALETLMSYIFASACLFDFEGVPLKSNREWPDSELPLPLSHVYFDFNRMQDALPNLLALGLITKMVREHGLEFDMVAGVSSSVLPLARLVAKHFNKPFVWVKENQTKWEIPDKMFGSQEPRGVALAIADCVTTADTKNRAVEVLGQHNVEVRWIIPLVDRQQRTSDDKPPYQILPIVTMAQLMEIGREYDWVTEEQMGLHTEYLKQFAAAVKAANKP